MQADTTSALAVLEQAVRLGHPEGYMRVFLDEGKPIETLLKIAIAQWKDHDLLAYARKLLAAFYQEQAERPVSPAKTSQGDALIEPLSERELEVLHLIAAGRSNQEIADKLVISVRDGQETRREHPRQARRPKPHPGRGQGPRAESAVAASPPSSVLSPLDTPS